jgi:hypothetical protein
MKGRRETKKAQEKEIKAHSEPVAIVPARRPRCLHGVISPVLKRWMFKRLHAYFDLL